ncbi:hypothetical protein UT300016_26890 [Clostridium senegalense]
MFNTKNQDAILVNKKDYKVGMGRSVYAVGGGLDNIKANVYLKGSDRFDTLKKVVKRIEL